MNKEQEQIRKKSPIQIKNRKASFEYFFIEEFTAGIVLTGTEIKSIRLGKASLVDTYCTIINNELWVKGMNISPYFYGSYNNHDLKRDRKLLLTRREINRLAAATKQTGYTIVPLLVFIDEKGRAKMDIALCKGKKEFDKRQTLKEKEDRREMDRAMKVLREKQEARSKRQEARGKKQEARSKKQEARGKKQEARDMIRTIIFDLGGVVITLDPQQAISRFEALGLKDAEERLDSYTQSGIFGDLEHGLITPEDFRREFGILVGREVTHEECAYAWQGYAKEVPQRNLETLEKLRQAGYRVLLLSNTNSYMMEWAESPAFDGKGHPVSYYFDHCYLSYQMKLMKPSEDIFRAVLRNEKTFASECLFVDDGARNVATASQLGMFTFCPENGADWTQEIYKHLK